MGTYKLCLLTHCLSTTNESHWGVHMCVMEVRTYLGSTYVHVWASRCTFQGVYMTSDRIRIG